MKNILLYPTQQDVENKPEGQAEVTGEFTYEVTTYYDGKDFFTMGDDKFVVLKYGYNRTCIVNMDNPIPKPTYYDTSTYPTYAKQPIDIHNPDTYEFQYNAYFKFEPTTGEVVVIHYWTGGGSYSTKNAVEGTVTLDNGVVLERVYLARAGDTGLSFEKFDHEENGEIYTNGCYSEFNQSAYPLDPERWKITSITPGVGYCRENRNVMYNENKFEVTIFYPGVGEKVYRTNYVSKKQMKDDFGLYRYPYIFPESTEWVDTGGASDDYNGYVFLKEANGKRYQITDLV